MVEYVLEHCLEDEEGVVEEKHAREGMKGRLIRGTK